LSALIFCGNALFAQSDRNVHGLNEMVLKKIDFKNIKDSLSVIKEVEKAAILNGYLGVKLDSTSNVNSELNFFFDAGVRYDWANVNLINDSSPLFNKRIRKKKVFRYELINARINRILFELENSGYPFANISVNNLQIDSTIDCSLEVNKGPYITIDSVILNGQTGINQKFLQNYVDIKEGYPYNESKIREIKNRIDELSFVRLKSSPEVIFDGTNCKLNLNLLRKKASKFNGIVGFLSDAETGKLLLQGDMRIDLNGVLGQGEEFHLAWNGLQESQQKLETSLYYPFLFNSNLNIKGNFELFRRDTLFNNVYAKASTGYILKRGNFFNFFISQKQSNTLTSVETVTLSLNQLDFQTNSYGFDFKLSKYDYALNPSKGRYLSGEVGLGRRRIIENPKLPESFSDSNDLISTQIRLLVDLGVFIPLGKKSTINFHSNIGLINADFNLENEMFRLGGLSSIRGFDAESIFANQYYIAKVEPRYLFEKNSVVFAFFEYANYISSSLTSERKGDLYSMGFGTNFETKAGILTLSYGIGRNIWKENGEVKDSQFRIRSAKVHFGIINYF
jgi:outer membrane protein assembly factor BamA